MNTRAARWTAAVGLLLVVATTVGMIGWTWKYCPDPVIDYGREVYVPWRLAEGQVLYRDINYFNGPLVPYFHALLFKVFGAGIGILKAYNAVLIVLLATLIYFMIRALSDNLSATVAGMLFPILFACQQFGGATFNSLTPYSYELPQSVAISLAMVACFWRASVSSRVLTWIAAAGFLLGLIFLTKAEVFGAALLSATAALACLAWSQRQSSLKTIQLCTLFILAALAPVLIATCLLWLAMPFSEVIRALAGSWKWAGDKRLTGMTFVRWMMGTDQTLLNLVRMFMWAGLYVAIATISVTIGSAVRIKSSAQRLTIGLVLAIVIAAALIAQRSWIPWRDALRPLPVMMLGVVIGIAVALKRISREATASFVLPLGFSVLAGALLAKIALNVHSYHYGFALAMPATMIFVALLSDWMPRHIQTLLFQKGQAQSNRVDCIVRAPLITVLVAAGCAYMRLTGKAIAERTHLVSAGGDSFYTAADGEYAQQALEFITSRTAPTDTLVCMPEGLLLNFMARRVNPTFDMNFSPPALVMYGEQNMLERLNEHSPDWIALVSTNTYVYDANFFGHDYAMQISQWVQDHYEPMQLFGTTPFIGDKPGIMILRHRRTGP